MTVAWSTKRYAPLAALGRGGMGEVDLVQDERLGRQVARKRMRNADADAEETERFLREAKLQGRLEHPAIVPVYDLDGDAPGPYFTMKRIRGETLQKLLARGLDTEDTRGWTTRAVLVAFAQIARAVHYAHSHGIVHRDLKPANIMLADFGEVYVLDWGLAKSRTESIAARTTTATEEGDLLGTPGYMAPEQIIDASAVTPAADVYALAAILFEILAHAPLHAPQSGAQTLAATLEGVSPQARLDSLATESRAVSIPPELLTLITSCMALEPKKRPRDAGVIAHVLQRYLDADRDLELRLKLAKEHRVEATALAQRALDKALPLDESLGHRREAIREVGRALALDPTAADALRPLITLLETPPREVPEEVQASIRQRESKMLRELARHGVRGWSAYFLFAPVLIWMGVLRWDLFLLTLAAAAIAAWGAAMKIYSRAQRGLHPAELIAGTIFVTCFSLVFGPLLWGPMIAITVSVPWLTVCTPKQRPQVIAYAIAGLALPTLAIALGWLPQPYAFVNGDLIVHPTVFSFAETPTYLFAFCSALVLIAVTANAARLFRDHDDAANRGAELLAWQLRQLMPKESAGTLPNKNAKRV